MSTDDGRGVGTGSIRTHRDLIVWQKAMRLTVETYELCQRFPRSEVYGQTSQLQRAVTSVPMNIAEGHGRGTRKDYAQFLSIARGSLMEVDTGIELAIRLRYITQSEAEPALSLLDEVLRMINSIRAKLRAQLSGK